MIYTTLLDLRRGFRGVLEVVREGFSTRTLGWEEEIGVRDSIASDACWICLKSEGEGGGQGRFDRRKGSKEIKLHRPFGKN